ncbi:MAG TPA: tripartite tricarboxylate transporter TctB family protein [Methylomirabilota bacterium]|jgi:putative tricarboxylic transport membrane protein
MRVRSPQDLVAGLVLVGLAVFALWASGNLSQGRLGALGPGMMPRATAVLVGIVGGLVVISALVAPGPRLPGWSIRGPLFVCLALIAFAVTIRWMGLVVAGPLVAIIGSAASPETRVKEILVFGIAVTIFSIALFKYVLNLPIPVLIIPGLIVL